jgi:hypothetical protein
MICYEATIVHFSEMKCRKLEIFNVYVNVISLENFYSKPATGKVPKDF